MERRTIIILIILAVIVGGYFLVMSILPANNTENGALTNNPPQSGQNENVAADPYRPATAEAKATFPAGEKLLISAQGGTVQVNNFFNRAEGYYPEMMSLLIVRNQKYQLVFYREMAEFSLTVFPGVLSEDILGIQGEIMTALGVGKGDFCKLKINYLSEYDGGEIEDLGTLPLCASVLK